MIRIRTRRRGPAANGEERDDLKSVPMQWRRMIGFLRPYKLRLLVSLGALVIGAGISLIFPQVIGQVIDSVFVGTDTRVHVSLKGGTELTVLVRNLDDDKDFKKGEKVVISYDASDSRLLPAAQLGTSDETFSGDNGGAGNAGGTNGGSTPPAVQNGGPPPTNGEAPKSKKPG